MPTWPFIGPLRLHGGHWYDLRRVSKTKTQRFHCHRCETAIDPVRAIARIHGSQIVQLCVECSDSSLSKLASVSQTAAVGALDDSLVHSETAIPAQRTTATRLSFAPSMKPNLGVRFILSVGLLVATPLSAWALHHARSASAEAPESADVAIPETRPESELISLFVEPLELLEPAAPILAEGDGWVHPVVGSEEQVPTKRTRLFKAARSGQRPDECGKGHCGVDLDGPRGTPVVAIRDGIIEKVMSDGDAKGGRYVWIFHEDVGLRTEYFHFDKIAPDMDVGVPVEAGQWLGTLGRTGIEHSQPHLHFTVRDASKGFRYIDPMPWLETAEVLPLLDMRLASAE